MGKKKIILDANIFISALGYAGNEREIISRCLKEEFSLYLTDDIVKELQRVVEYPKFKFTFAQKDALKLILSETAIIIQPAHSLNLVKADPSDNKYLEAALAAEADFLITGDKHLLFFKQIGPTRIISSADFLKLV